MTRARGRVAVLLWLAAAYPVVVHGQRRLIPPPTAPVSIARPAPRATGRTAAARRARHVGFDIALPDFTDCSFATPEADGRLVRRRARAAARCAPSIALCRRSARRSPATRSTGIVRPRARLLRRHALAARRAQPAAPARHRKGVSGERGGAHHVDRDARDARAVSNQLRLRTSLRQRATSTRSSVPVDVRQARKATRWQRGLGDIAVAVKHVLFHSLASAAHRQRRRRTGPADRQGKRGARRRGRRCSSRSCRCGQICRASGFVQAQVGLEVPDDARRAATRGVLARGGGKTCRRNGASAALVADDRGARRARAGERAHRSSGTSCRSCR